MVCAALGSRPGPRWDDIPTTCHHLHLYPRTISLYSSRLTNLLAEFPGIVIAKLRVLPKMRSSRRRQQLHDAQISQFHEVDNSFWLTGSWLTDTDIHAS